MRKIVTAALLPIVLSGAGPANAESAPAAPPAATPLPAASKDALRLAGLYMQEDLASARALSEFETSFDAGFAKDAQAAMLETRFPGLKEAAKAAGRKVFEQQYLGAMPRWKAVVARQLDSLFTPAEIGQLLTFFGSPDGKRIVATLIGGAKLDDLRERAIKDGENFKLGSDDIAKSLSPALTSLDKDQLIELFRFSASPIGRKFQKNSSAIQTVMLNEINGTMSAVQGPMQQAVIEAVAAHIANSGKGQ